jgi:hypothetical protein
MSYVNGDLDEYQIQPTAGPAEATFSQAPGTWLAIMITFRPEAAAPTSQSITAAASVSPFNDGSSILENDQQLAPLGTALDEPDDVLSITTR